MGQDGRIRHKRKGQVNVTVQVILRDSREMINEELREQAISEYVEDYKKEILRNNKKIWVLSLCILFAVLTIVVVVIPSFRYILAGRYQDGVMDFSVGLIVIALLVAPAVVTVWLAMRISFGNYAKRFEDELRKTTWHICDGELVREIEGDERRTTSFSLGEITNVSKEGNLITFDYKDSEVEALDFYDPPLYDSLKDLR